MVEQAVLGACSDPLPTLLLGWWLWPHLVVLTTSPLNHPSLEEHPCVIDAVFLHCLTDYGQSLMGWVYKSPPHLSQVGP